MKTFKVFLIFLLGSFFYNLLLTFLKLDLSYIYQIFLIFAFIILLPSVKKTSFISVFYVLFNIMPFVLSIEKLGFLTGFSYFLTTALLPVVFYEYLKNGFTQNNFNLIINYILLKYSLYLILIPIEFFVTSKSSMAELQFSGGQYNSIAVLILLIIILYVAKSFDFKIKKTVLPLAIVLIFSTILVSFSRGGFVIGLVLLLAFTHKIKLKYFLIGSSLVAICFFQFSGINIEDMFVLKYWLLRLDLFNNVTGESSISISNLLSSYNYDSRSFFYTILNDRSFLDILVGSGIGSSKLVINEFSNGNFAFGSFHNLFLTILVERGLLFLSFFTILLLGTLSKMLIIIKKNRYILFMSSFALMLFAVTTGFELFVNSRDFNVDFILLFFLLVYLINLRKNEFKFN
jgi:hypothetical protein